MSEVVSKSRPAIHQCLIRYFAEKERGSVLDVPAGYGYLSEQLQELGYQVTAGEIEPAIFKAGNVRCIYADLNRRIVAPDQSFDYICCVEGLEHMTDPYTAVAELSRVLKTGGTGIFSIPNYSSMEKRLSFFWRGILSKSKTLEEYRKTGNLYNFHNSLLTITILNFMFEVNGLKLKDVLIDRVKKKQRLFYPLYLLMKIDSLFQSRDRRVKYGTNLTLDKRVILGSNTLILVVEKLPPSER